MLSKRKSESGQVAALIAGVLVVLLAVTGLAVDMGMIWTQRRQMQTAADAAALAGDHEIYSNNGSDSVLAPVVFAAKTDSLKNGYADGVKGVTVTVNAPPLTGDYKDDKYAVEVIVRDPLPTYFLRALGISTMPVSTRAVARYSPSTGCVYSLGAGNGNPPVPGSSNASKALSVTGSGLLNSICNVYVNSTNSGGLACSGTITLTSPATLNTTASSPSSCGSTTVTDNASVAANPFASLAVPSEPGVVSASALSISKSGHAPLNPGTYVGGINVSGGGVSVSLNPGLYYLKGGGLNVTGGANITSLAGGVTFFNTGTNSGSTAYKPIVISASSTTLTAPSSGTYQGILFFQDPGICAVTSGACDSPGGTNGKQNTVSGNSPSTVFNGAMYFPNTPLAYTGAAGVTNCLELVADAITISGSSSVTNNCSLFGDSGAPLKFPALAE